MVAELVELAGACPHCADAAQHLMELPADPEVIKEVMGVAGGVAGTIALIIQTSNDLHDLYLKLSGQKSVEEVKHECNEGGGDASRSEVQEALETLREADLDKFECRCEDCSNQVKLTEFA